MPRTYVDNAMNRSLGRVGMAHGTAVHSSSSGGSYSSSPRTYVDNSHNRSLGRVGMEHGTAVHSSRSGGSSSSSSRTYVDNSLNRSLGRVGMEHGTAVYSSNANSSNRPSSVGSSSASPRVYADNSYNRANNRVGLEIGTAVISKKGTTSSSKTYVDNSYNRKHGRVGKPLGSVSISRTPTDTSKSQRTYVDNYYNRSLGRVGMPLGSMPSSKKSSSKNHTQKLYRDIVDHGKYDMEDVDDNYGIDIAEIVCDMVERMKVWQSVKAEKQLESQSGYVRRPSTFDAYVGKVIEFEEIELGERIGHGGFGDVFSALWHGKEVAVKKLRVQRVSRKRLAQFEEEINIFSKLRHENIVEFYGACIRTPNICMVMELMSDSLYDVIHVKQVQFTDARKHEIVTDIAHGLNYLHSKGIAHCDVKSTNVLLNIFDNDEVDVKLTDFGLSLIKNDTESTSSKHQRLGTPRYSAPEVLRGEMLSQSEMKLTDVYSYGLIVYEVMCEEEPFDGLNVNQLRKQVGECGLTPPLDLIRSKAIKDLLQRCWLRQAKQRPRMIDVIEILG